MSVVQERHRHRLAPLQHPPRQREVVEQVGRLRCRGRCRGARRRATSSRRSPSSRRESIAAVALRAARSARGQSTTSTSCGSISRGKRVRSAGCVSATTDRPQARASLAGAGRGAAPSPVAEVAEGDDEVLPARLRGVERLVGGAQELGAVRRRRTGRSRRRSRRGAASRPRRARGELRPQLVGAHERAVGVRPRRASARTRRRRAGQPRSRVAQLGRGSGRPSSTSTRSPRSCPPRSLTTLNSSQSSTQRLSGLRSAPRALELRLEQVAEAAPVEQAGERIRGRRAPLARRSRAPRRAKPAACAARSAAASARRRGKASASGAAPTSTPTSTSFTRSGSQTSVRSRRRPPTSPASATSTRSKTDGVVDVRPQSLGDELGGERGGRRRSGSSRRRARPAASSPSSTWHASRPRTCASERAASSAIARASRRELMWTSSARERGEVDAPAPDEARRAGRRGAAATGSSRPACLVRQLERRLDVQDADESPSEQDRQHELRHHARAARARSPDRRAHPGRTAPGRCCTRARDDAAVERQPVRHHRVAAVRDRPEALVVEQEDRPARPRRRLPPRAGRARCRRRARGFGAAPIASTARLQPVVSASMKARWSVTLPPAALARPIGSRRAEA